MATGRAILLAGVSAQASTEDWDGLPQECATIFLSDYIYSTAQWILRVSCQLEAGDARAHVATIITTPLRRALADPLSNARPPTRAIARFNMPGARAWFVDGRLLKVYAAEEETLPKMHKAMLYVDASRGNGGQAVELLEGIVVPKQNYRGNGGLGAGSQVVPQGAVIQQVSFSATAAGDAWCNVSIDGDVKVRAEIDAAQAHSFAPAQCMNYLGDTTVEFGADVASWFVSWVV